MQNATLQNMALMDMAAAEAYEEILNTYQTYSIDAVAEVAHFLRHQDIYNVALPLYHYLLKHQQSADDYFGMGQCYGKTYQYETALPYLQQAFQLQPERTDGCNYYAYILERNLLMEQADQWYQTALSQDYAKDLWTLSHYAYFLEKYDQPVAAEQVYQEVLRHNPTYTWAMKRYALFLLKQGQSDRSLALMQTAIEQYSKNPFVQLNYLEYLIIREDRVTYECYLRSLDYANAVLPLQVLIDLFNYFQYFLLQGQADSEKLVAYQEKISRLKNSIHRDFDDLNELLLIHNGDLAVWQQMTQLLVK